MVATDRKLHELCMQQFLVAPYIPENVNPASIDLTLSARWIDTIDVRVMNVDDEITIYPPSSAREWFYKLHLKLWNLLGGRLLSEPVHKPTAILATTEEFVMIPVDKAANVLLKSSRAREGLDHSLAGWIDPGFHGQITLELHSHRKVTIKKGQRICQLIVYDMGEPADNPYNGRYQNQVDPTPAREELTI